ncbi:uncharacterized protein LOC130211175 [Pseudoliparis swirei]|uniref:uncharacterized protein LOC130211175 n=1 Tax=Pseudoliparis swirei TaxID=2059687 RepID=UPI0024BE1520|nr:uncharacterized protein LOC130211175 [Pseudoliparis swirei]
MGKKGTNNPKLITPVDVVQRNNHLISSVTNVAKISEKWSKRWPQIDRPWPLEGTLNPDVIQIMHVLVSTYKAEQKKGNQGRKRKEKRQLELGVLQLFADEGQKMIATASVMYPKTVCPQVSVSSQKGRPQISDESDQEEVKGGCDPKAKWSRAEEADDSEEEYNDEEDSQMTLSEVRELQPIKRELLQSNKVPAPRSMFPVIIREQGFEYRPLQSTDMSAILEKLPIIEDGAHPWIAKLEQILVGDLPAMGDIKKLLANVVGVYSMEDILEKAGLNQYVGTSVNDSDLFAASRGRVFRALKETFPTNIDPANILIEPLGLEENPRSFVSRSHQTWMNITGNDPEQNLMDKSILRG